MKTKTPKLTPTQTEIMKFLKGGWSAYTHLGYTEINGSRFGPVSSLTALEKKGLVERDGKYEWKATAAGKTHGEVPGVGTMLSTSLGKAKITAVFPEAFWTYKAKLQGQPGWIYVDKKLSQLVKFNRELDPGEKPKAQIRETITAEL